MKIHELKTDPEYFLQIMSGKKNCEIRLDDRRYKYGDYLVLKETQFNGEDMKCGKPLVYTGKVILARITHKFDDMNLGGLREGWCVLSIKVLDVVCSRLSWAT